MKNSIVIKFIAIVLCAASLLAAVGSGFGIFALTETGAYDTPADELFRQMLEENAELQAYHIAERYASLNLGGCPERMVTNYDRFSNYGYQLYDEFGNLLDSRELDTTENTLTFEFTPSGDYMHVVNVTAHPMVEETVYSNHTGVVFIDNIPYEGVEVYTLNVTYPDGSSEGYGSDDPLGYLTHSTDGIVVYHALQNDRMGFEDSTAVDFISLEDANGEVIYEVTGTNVGTLMYDSDGRLIFLAEYTASPAETESTEPTLPEETVEVTETTETVEATIAVDTPEEGYLCRLEADVDIYSLPSTESGKVGSMLAGSTIELTGVESVNGQSWGKLPGSGWIALEQVTLYSAVAQTTVTADPTDETIVAETAAESTEETVSETTEETVPETTEETVPETTEETVPETAEETVPETSEETVPETTEPEAGASPVPYEPVFTDDETVTYDYVDHVAQERVSVEYIHARLPEYRVVLTVVPGNLGSEASYQVLGLVQTYQDYLIPALILGVVLFAITAVYLCCAAGRKPGSAEVRAAGLNCISLDLYAVGAVLAISGLCIACVEGGYYLMQKQFLVGCAFSVASAYAACLVFVAFCFAFAAQVKTPDRYWMKNSLCGRCVILLGRIWNFAIGKTDEALMPAAKKIVKRLWGWTVALVLLGWKLIVKLYYIAKQLWLRLWAFARKWLIRSGKAAKRIYTLLPLTWQWVLTGFILGLWLLISVDSRSEGMLLVWVCAAIAIVLYGAHCFGTLLESAKRMSKGDLDTKVDDKLMVGSFEDFAKELNNLADVVVAAARKQLKSERMKTELITNVSHDIKTPLTSIINYVDLLQKPHSEAEGKQYLEVLDRQSLRLKKLIDDLMEMSKASTGNMAVDISDVDAVESVNQALGEFSDKLAAAHLTPLFRKPEEPVIMLADGRLVWRVLSNLLSNAVKYAMPGTRLYIDLSKQNGSVILSLKNISREELNLDAEELMERFVRGDDSRNTEGSGLGLNIAKSLMELQHGKMNLIVDGDLFKVTLVFPEA